MFLSAVGWWASFALLRERFVLLEDPQAALGCDFSVLVQCGSNLSSWQGEVFGFPNPVMGLTGFAVTAMIGIAMIARATFARWFWAGAQVGVAAGLAFVGWLIQQSIDELGTLCPWCMVVWSVMIPLFLLVSLLAAAAGVWGTRAADAAGWFLPWLVPATIAAYLGVALLAQLRLDVLSYL